MIVAAQYSLTTSQPTYLNKSLTLALYTTIQTLDEDFKSDGVDQRDIKQVMTDTSTCDGQLLPVVQPLRRSKMLGLPSEYHDSEMV